MTTRDLDLAARLGVRKAVLAGATYVPDWLDLNRAEYLRLDRNESTQPISPRLGRALAEHVVDVGVHTYPEVDALAPKLAAYCGVPEDWIVVTNGSDQAIDLCLRAFLGGGDRMLVAQPEFPVFSHVAGMLGAVVEGVPYSPDLTFPYDAFTTAATTNPALVVVINPNNPTGTPVDVDYIARLAADNPELPVLVDEAYYEYTGTSVVGLIAEHPNLIVIRTFSKAFAMAGLRLGYVIAHPDMAAQLVKLRNPFDVNELAVLAAGIQLDDLDAMRTHVDRVMTVAKPMTLDFFGTHGVPVHPGAANFMLVRPADVAQAIASLREAGILVRSMSAPALAGTFRMSVGTPDEMRRFFDVYATRVLSTPRPLS